MASFMEASSYAPELMAPLAQLASQHHTSTYSVAKFGAKGSPVLYAPLSLHLPSQYHQLLERQRQQFAQIINPWSRHAISPLAESTIVLGPSGSNKFLPSELAKELSQALDDSMPMGQKDFTNAAHPVKTSNSHPINISPMIPEECIPIISSHALLASASSNATPLAPIFEIPNSFLLDRLVFPPRQPSSLSSYSHKEHLKSIGPQMSSNHLRTRSLVSEALQAAINSRLSSISTVDVRPSSPQPPSDPQLKLGIVQDHLASSSFQASTSSVSLSVSLTLSTSSLSHCKTCSTHSQERSSTPSSQADDPSPIDETSEHSPLRSSPLFSHDLSPVPDLPSFRIGNLFLSSCPGKKVRLQGPVKGRSSVCRDLETDLRRMKDLGVGCVVCCLDDNELEFLGSPWSDYERVTKELGIDVLRLPTPEGLAPSLSASYLNHHLNTLINEYTLRGIPVLVHCRGGVGRAGVVACCWILKLGLCGWFDHSAPLSAWAQSSSPTADGPARLDTLQLVNKVIQVVRRRRSVKAIETYEQVQFLVDFAEFLRTGADS